MSLIKTQCQEWNSNLALTPNLLNSFGYIPIAGFRNMRPG